LFLPDEAKLGNKTGAREGIVHDCGVVKTDKFGYAVCVFTSGARSAGDASVAIGRISRGSMATSSAKDSAKIRLTDQTVFRDFSPET
jgi:DNA gyrase inhibitor GyrI